jgi:KUP system potassium uptake protein
MRADNNGEGGIMSLLALLLRIKELTPNQKMCLLLWVLLGLRYFLEMVSLPRNFSTFCD